MRGYFDPSLPSLFPDSLLVLAPQTGPQTVILNHTDLLPCLCVQVGWGSGGAAAGAAQKPSPSFLAPGGFPEDPGIWVWH